jgi:hypothetical protein
VKRKLTITIEHETAGEPFAPTVAALLAYHLSSICGSLTLGNGDGPNKEGEVTMPSGARMTWTAEELLL